MQNWSKGFTLIKEASCSGPQWFHNVFKFATDLRVRAYKGSRIVAKFGMNFRTPAVSAPHVARSVSGCMHGDATACDRLGKGRVRKAVDEHGVHHTPNVHQPKVPLLVAGVLHPLTLCGKSLQNNVLVISA